MHSSCQSGSGFSPCIISHGTFACEWGGAGAARKQGFVCPDVERGRGGLGRCMGNARPQSLLELLHRIPGPVRQRSKHVQGRP